MPVSLLALEIDAQDPVRLARFWAQLLERDLDESGVRLPGRAAADFALWFVQVGMPKQGLHRMHCDLTSSSLEDQRATVDRALGLGGRHLDVGQRGDEGHVVLADPEGNEFCVIEPFNDFLQDTGRIGALAGDGLARVGHFWSAALGWPLVWDQDEETAIQSPAGGTKITWGGPPVMPKQGRNRLRWVLLADDLAVAVDHLTSLGAQVLDRGHHRVELADPEGNELVVVDETRGARSGLRLGTA